MYFLTPLPICWVTSRESYLVYGITSSRCAMVFCCNNSIKSLTSFDCDCDPLLGTGWLIRAGWRRPFTTHAVPIRVGHFTRRRRINLKCSNCFHFLSYRWHHYIIAVQKVWLSRYVTSSRRQTTVLAHETTS